jgi:hypothetical protein
MRKASIGIQRSCSQGRDRNLDVRICCDAKLRARGDPTTSRRTLGPMISAALQLPRIRTPPRSACRARTRRPYACTTRLHTRHCNITMLTHPAHNARIIARPHRELGKRSRLDYCMHAK